MKNYYLDRANEKEEQKPEENFVYIICNDLNIDSDWIYSADSDSDLNQDWTYFNWTHSDSN